MREDPDRVQVDEAPDADGDDSAHLDVMALTDAERAEIAASAHAGLLEDD